MKFRFLLLIFITISFFGSGFSQKYILFPTYNVDSLLNLIPAQTGIERINSLNKLSSSLSFIDYDSSMNYAEEAKDLAIKLNYDIGIADAFRSYGHIYEFKGNYPEALENYFETLSIYKKNNDHHNMMWLYYEIGRMHFYANNFDKAVEYGYLSLKKCNEHLPDGSRVGDLVDSVRIGGAIAISYSYAGNNEEALKQRLRLLEVMQGINFSKIEILMTTWVTGANYYLIGKTDSASVYFRKAISFPGENMNIEAQKYRALTWMGALLFSASETDTAINYLQKSLDWYSENGFLIWALYSSNILGNFYLNINDDEKSEEYYKKSEMYFDEMLTRNSWYRYDSLKYIPAYGLEYFSPLPITSMKEMLWDWGEWMFHGLYKINVKKNNTEEALRYHIAYTNAGDSLSKIRRNRELIELQTKYETEKKEEQIEYLSQENNLNELKLKQTRYFLFGMVGFVVLIIIVSLFIIRLNKLRDKQHSLILQQKLFRSQMNPHFIFNSLTSIQNFILDEESGKASKYLSRFSKLVRHILDSSVEEFVTLEEEISTIKNYLELQKIRFKDKFNYTIEVDESLNLEEVNIPPMLAQPFIENSIEHGIKNKKIKGNIYIRFYAKNNHIAYEIEDDGIGRQKAMERLNKHNKDHKSLATAITFERIKVLNKKLKKKIRFSIQDLMNTKYEPTGTKVIIEIPNI